MRAKKNTVGIEAVKGMLRLRLPRTPFDGKQKYLSLGLSDTPANRNIAQNKATQIEYDIAIERFDFTLARYKPSYQKESTPELIELWERYTEVKSKELSITTINKDFKKTRNHILGLPTQRISSAKTIRSHLVKTLSSDSAKRVIVQINACLEWAVGEDLIKVNPFTNIKIKSKKSHRTINPFSKAEKDLIINAFEKSEAHGHYSGFVKFLFLTGCRPSEAIALKWEHISSDFSLITFSEAWVEGQRKDTKTHKVRRFPVNEQLKNLLRSLRDYQVDYPVFLSKEGCVIDEHNFSERNWKPLLNALPITYRKVYNCRHTFITHCLEAGIPVNQIAEWVGNSAKTIWEHYAGLVTNFDVPEL